MRNSMDLATGGPAGRSFQTTRSLRREQQLHPSLNIICTGSSFTQRIERLLAREGKQADGLNGKHVPGKVK